MIKSNRFDFFFFFTVAILQALKEDCARKKNQLDMKNLERYIDRHMYNPVYVPMVSKLTENAVGT